MSSYLVDYIPILTTCFSIVFFVEIFKHYRERKTYYLFWWAAGVATFGLGTFSESLHALIGWQSANLKFWYIIGALLGGFPLAQGSVYLLMNRRFAHTTTYIFLITIFIASIAVVLTPISLPDAFNGRLTGAVFEWKWVRLFSPFINIYSFLFLVGGALYSAILYYGKKETDARFKGNILIAIGALLPGIGGSFTRLGYVEVLFVTELLGLLLIYAGYKIIKVSRRTQNSVSLVS